MELRKREFDHTTHHDIPDGGFIRFVDVLGNDKAIAETARLTAGLLDAEVLNKKTPDDDVRLIRRLMRDIHTSPFEFCEVVVKLRVPMDTWRQMVRHRTFNVNEYSTRYSPAIDDTSVVEPGDWRKQSGSNRQGSSGKLDNWPEALLLAFGEYLNDDRLAGGPICDMSQPDLLNSVFIERLRHGLSINPKILRATLDRECADKTSEFRGCTFHGSSGLVDIDDAQLVYQLWRCFLETKGLTMTSLHTTSIDYSVPQDCLSALELSTQRVARDFYEFLLTAGVAREQARRDLVLSTFTEVVWKCDLHNICHFLKLRLAPDAQVEVRAYANAFAEIIKTLFPVTYQAFEDYRLRAVTLSRMEFENLITTLSAVLAENRNLGGSLTASVTSPTVAGTDPGLEFLKQTLVPESNEITTKSELDSFLVKFRPLLQKLGIPILSSVR